MMDFLHNLPFKIKRRLLSMYGFGVQVYKEKIPVFSLMNLISIITKALLGRALFTGGFETKVEV